MPVTVKAATPEDLEELLVLLEEMDRFYGATDADLEPLEIRRDQANNVLFAAAPLAYALLARDGEQLVGLASYSFLWPAAGLTTSLYLKELYVSQGRRKSGVGSALMSTLHEIAAERGCSRVEWTTDEGNADAQRFYATLGHTRLPTKLFYRAEQTGT